MEKYPQEEYEKFSGLWIQVSCNADGMENPVENYGAFPTVKFTNNQFVVSSAPGEVVIEGLFSVNPYAAPKEIDWFDTFGEDTGKYFRPSMKLARIDWHSAQPMKEWKDQKNLRQRLGILCDFLNAAMKRFNTA